MTDQLQKKTKAWSGRFSEPISEKVQDYTASIHFDKKLALFDIQGSKAHAQMLEKVGILSNEELNKILQSNLDEDQDISPWFCLSLEDNSKNHFLRAKQFSSKFNLLKDNKNI